MQSSLDKLSETFLDRYVGGNRDEHVFELLREVNALSRGMKKYDDMKDRKPENAAEMKKIEEEQD